MPYPQAWWTGLSAGERRARLRRCADAGFGVSAAMQDIFLSQLAHEDGWTQRFSVDGVETWTPPEDPRDVVHELQNYYAGQGLRRPIVQPGQILDAEPAEENMRFEPVLPPDAPRYEYIASSEEPQEENQMSSTAFINRFLVGADPEFLLLDGQTRITVGGQMSKRVGYDHGGRVVELRPKPSISTYTLLKNIRQLLQSKVLDQYRKYTWRGGAYFSGEAIGGHVHFDIPVIFDRSKGDIVDALDETTRLLEALDILPKDESKARRDSSGYGKFGAFKAGDGEERKEKGGDPHMEYRTPASWLFSPKVAFCTLTALKLAAARPRTALRTLKGTSGFRELKAFIEAFRGRDDDASRLYDKLLSGGLTSVQAPVAEDFKPKWQEVGF